MKRIFKEQKYRFIIYHFYFSGNDPRENRKFNMIKQGLDYDSQGEYIRLWIEELRGIKDGKVHNPWTLSRGELERSGVELGVTYPNPIVIAPEWSRHTNKKDRGPPAKGQKGIDFYFKSDGSKKTGNSPAGNPNKKAYKGKRTLYGGQEMSICDEVSNIFNCVGARTSAGALRQLMGSRSPKFE